MARLTLTPPFDQWRWARDLAVTPVGKFWLIASSAPLAWWLMGGERGLAAVSCVAACTAIPRRRRVLLGATSLALAVNPSWNRWVTARSVLGVDLLDSPAVALLFRCLVVAVVVAGFLAYARLAYATKGELGRHAVGVLIGTYVLVATAVVAVPAPPQVRFFVAAVVSLGGQYLWYFCYALHDGKTFEQTAGGMVFFRPFWGGTDTPFPKGPAYIAKIEARSDAELAVAQLKGLKLLWWASVLKLLSVVIHAVFVDADVWFGVQFSLPEFREVFATHRSGGDTTMRVRWASTVLHFSNQMLNLTIFGHTVVGTIRLAGFNALRNTYRPLESRTLVDFWNRFYFYYKELLVAFFFYPAFLHFFTKHRAPRIVFATFAAACFGNFVFHYARDLSLALELGLVGYLKRLLPFAFYTAVLSLGISISQLRRLRSTPTPPAENWLRAKVWQPALVFAFYCSLSIFNEAAHEEASLLDHLRFFCALFLPV